MIAFYVQKRAKRSTGLGKKELSSGTTSTFGKIQEERSFLVHCLYIDWQRVLIWQTWQKIHVGNSFSKRATKELGVSLMYDSVEITSHSVKAKKNDVYPNSIAYSIHLRFRLGTVVVAFLTWALMI